MKTLVIQLRQLGDVLMTTPSLAALKRAAPGSEIHFLVQRKCACVVRGNPDVDKVILADETGFAGLALRLRRERYDAIVDFQGLPKTALLSRLANARMRVGFARRGRTPFYTDAIERSAASIYSAMEKARLLAFLNVEVRDFGLRLPVTARDENDAAALAHLLKLGGAGPLAAFSPVSRRDYKRWPLSRYAELCDALHARHNIRFLPLFGPGEADVIEKVIALSACRGAFYFPYAPVSFNALLPLLKRCAFYFGNDNGIRHVAVAAGLPTAAVFGTPDPRAWTPPDNARHCWLWGKEAMESISVTGFQEKIETLLHENKIV